MMFSYWQNMDEDAVKDEIPLSDREKVATAKRATNKPCMFLRICFMAIQIISENKYIYGT